MKAVRGIIACTVLAVLLLVVFFDMEVKPEFAWPQETEVADPQQEARFDACVEQITDEATRQALAEADNPDVQSLMIRMRQKEALQDCRRRFPVQSTTLHEPLRINLIDIHWRFESR
jgi:hypothetical protein